MAKQGDIVQGKEGVRYVFLGGDESDKSRWAPLPTPEEPASIPSFAESYGQELDSRNFFGKASAGVGILPTQIYMGGGHVGQGETPRDIQQIQAYKQLGATAGGAVGNIAANMAVMGPAYGAVAGPGAIGSMAGRIGMAGLLGGSQGFMTSPGERASGTAWGAGGAAVAAAGAEGLNAYAQSRFAASEQMRILNEARDQATREAKAAGFKIPPAMSNPGFGVNTASGLSGKATIPQMASTSNDRMVQKALASELGVPAITPKSIKDVKNAAGEVYQSLRDVGTFVADDEFVRNIAKIGERNAQAGRLVSSMLDPEVAKLSETTARLGNVPMKSDEAVSLLQEFRDKATENFANNHTGLAKAQKAAANEIEALIARNLEKTGNTKLFQDFQAARVRLAKANVIQNAMSLSGHVNPMEIVKQAGEGERLTGMLGTISRVAAQYPGAFQQDLKGNVALRLSMANLFLGAIGSGAGYGAGLGPAGIAGGLALGATPPAIGALTLGGRGLWGIPRYATQAPQFPSWFIPGATAAVQGAR